MSEKFKKLISSETFIIGFACFALLLVRYFWQGVAYYPQMDDYIQYHNYASFYGSLGAAIENLGLLRARPLAGIMDIAVWSKLWGNMHIAVMIISALYVVSGILFKNVFEKYFNMSNIFLVIYLLSPFFFEAVYWISASSRIVLGLFFTAVALYLFQLYFERDSKAILAVSFLVQLIAFCFYEQAMVISITVTMFIGIFRLIKKDKRCFTAVVTFINVVLYYLITNIQSSSTLYDSRMKIVLPFMGKGFISNFRNSLNQYIEIFTDGFVNIGTKGFVKGLTITQNFNGIIAIILTLLLCAVFVMAGIRYNKCSDTDKKFNIFIGIIVSFLVFLAPLTPFFIIENAYIPMRNGMMAMLGLAMLVDILASDLLKNKKAVGVICAVMIFCFTVSAFSEIETYRLSYEADAKLVEAASNVEFSSNTAIIGIDEHWVKDQSFMYKEHVSATSGSPWSLTGMLRCCLKNQQLPLVTPISAEVPYMSWSYESKKLSNFDTIYHYVDDSFIKLECEQTGEKTYELTKNGQPYAKMYDNKGMGVFELYDK
ncbi:MAG: glucosyltransferase domain-containing protein [Clostridia bacterium]|nr:glucosyltransferase domain-containing protein [Clostridia bacterium]